MLIRGILKVTMNILIWNVMKTFHFPFIFSFGMLNLYCIGNTFSLSTLSFLGDVSTAKKPIGKPCYSLGSTVCKYPRRVPQEIQTPNSMQISRLKLAQGYTTRRLQRRHISSSQSWISSPWNKIFTCTQVQLIKSNKSKNHWPSQNLTRSMIFSGPFSLTAFNCFTHLILLLSCLIFCPPLPVLFFHTADHLKNSALPIQKWM